MSLAFQERVYQRRILGEMGEDAKLNLGVVGGEQEPRVAVHSGRAEGLPHLAAQLRADGDVLEVGVVAGDASGGRPRLVVAGVDAAGAGVDEGGKGIDVGGLQLGHLPVVQHLLNDRMGALQGLQRIGVGGIARLRALRLGEALLLEQHLAQLLGRADLEGVANVLVDGGFQLGNLHAKVFGHLLKAPAVQGYAVALHPDKHVDERHFHLLEDVPEAVVLQPLFQDGTEATGVVGVGAGVGNHVFDGHLGHSYLLAARAYQGLDGGHLEVEHVQGQVLEADGLDAQQIRGHHRVAGHAANLNAIVSEGGDVVVQIVTALGDLRVFQQGLQRRQHLFQRKLAALLMTYGHVPRLAGRGGEAQAHQGPTPLG